MSKQATEFQKKAMSKPPKGQITVLKRKNYMHDERAIRSMG